MRRCGDAEGDDEMIRGEISGVLSTFQSAYCLSWTADRTNRVPDTIGVPRIPAGRKPQAASRTATAPQLQLQAQLLSDSLPCNAGEG
jgi:hypothetical protein